LYISRALFWVALAVKEHQIVEAMLGPQLKDEVMKIMPVQKQTRAGQRTRFKAFVVVGDGNGHVGLGVKCSKEVATAIRGAIILAKLSVIPVRRGYWGNKIGKPHTVPVKVTGKCVSVTVRMVPAPRGAGIVATRVPKKVLQFAGIEDVFTSSRGSTKTLGNFVKILTNGAYKSVEHRAIVNALRARLSVATFYDPSKQTRICPAPELATKDSLPRYREVIYGDYVSAWYTKGPEGKRNIDRLAVDS
jgi:ribosomal protein uS5